jgi:hypothetical protein
MSATSLTLTTPLAVTSGGTGLATTAQGTLLSSTALNTISATATPTLGVAGTTAGSLGLSGSTSGVVTINTAATAGTWSMTLPTSGGTNGYILTTNGSGVTSWTNPTALGVDLDVGGTAVTGGTDTYILYNNNGTLGNYAVTGTGTTAVMSTSPALSGNVTLDSATFSPSSPGTNGNMAMTGTLAMGSSFLRNRIINGDMRIDQRNAGASGTAGAYTVDRWLFNASLATKGTWQQNAGSVTPPVGFSNYLGFTSNSSYSVTSGDYFTFVQFIEGLNLQDLAWGTVSAKTITISFWVRSSLTGTFGGVINNGAFNRSYPFTYVINSANTWEQKSITIPGDTTGTWLTTNGIGISLQLSMGSGATYAGTPSTWASTVYASATGCQSVVGTNGATFYITGVQLEVGSVATPFERRQYGTELMLCQRYLPASKATVASGIVAIGQAYSTTEALVSMPFQVTPRTSPTGAIVSSAAHFLCWQANAGGTTPTGVIFNQASLTTATLQVSGMTGLVAGNSTSLSFGNASGNVYFTGCEL